MGSLRGQQGPGCQSIRTHKTKDVFNTGVSASLSPLLGQATSPEETASTLQAMPGDDGRVTTAESGAGGRAHDTWE